MKQARPLQVVDYDLAWPIEFGRLRADLQHALGSLALRIEHVGSTAVPGLPAKPIIDLDIVIADRALEPEVISRLAELGYLHEGDLGIKDRQAFRPPHDLTRHHLYVCIEGCLALRNHLAVRDALRTDPKRAAEYGRLKRAWAARDLGAATDYGRAKTAFLLELLRDAGFCADDIASIQAANA